jgi:hypothetical protein
VRPTTLKVPQIRDDNVEDVAVVQKGSACTYMRRRR